MPAAQLFPQTIPRVLTRRDGAVDLALIRSKKSPLVGSSIYTLCTFRKRIATTGDTSASYEKKAPRKFSE
jgi:hypothetical protein